MFKISLFIYSFIEFECILKVETIHSNYKTFLIMIMEIFFGSHVSWSMLSFC